MKPGFKPGTRPLTLINFEALFRVLSDNFHFFIFSIKGLILMNI